MSKWVLPYLALVVALVALVAGAPCADATERAHVASGTRTAATKNARSSSSRSATSESTPTSSVDLLAIPFEAYSSKLAGGGPARARTGPVHRSPRAARGVPARRPRRAHRRRLPRRGRRDVRRDRRPRRHARRRAYGVPLSTKCVALFVNDDLLPKTPADDRRDRRAQGQPPAGRVPARLRHHDRVLPRAVPPCVRRAMLDADGHFAFFGDKAGRARSTSFASS